MPPFEVKIVPFPQQEEPTHGHFMRVWRDTEAERKDAQDWLGSTYWKAERRSKVGEQLMPTTDEDDYNGLGTSELLDLLRNSQLDVVYMSNTDGAILLPQMIEPQVPFYTAENKLPPSLCKLCNDVLARSLRPPAVPVVEESTSGVDVVGGNLNGN